MDIMDYNEDLASKWAETLSAITGLPFLLCREEKYNPSREEEGPLCKLLQEHAAGRVFCEQDCTAPLVQAFAKGEPVYFKCYANLNNVAIPVCSDKTPDKRHLILGGRIVSSYADLAGYRGVAEKLGCDQARVLETAKGISLRDLNHFKVAMEAIKIATLHLFQNREKYKIIEDRMAKLQTMIKVVSSTAAADNRELYHTILNTLGVLFNVQTVILLLRDVDEERFRIEEVFGYQKEALDRKSTRLNS